LLPLPRGLGRRCCGARRRHHSSPRRFRGAHLALAACAASSTDRPVVGASAPTTGACSSAASAALGEGARDSTSQGGAPHRSPLLPPLPTTSSPELPGERVPAARTAGTPRSAAPGAPAAGFSSPSCVPPAPAPVAARRRQPLGLGAWAGRTARRPRSPSTKKRLSKPCWYVAREREREEGLLTTWVSGSITNDQRSSLLCRPALRLMARLALVAAYS
jgi:hypothetical protein